ncbi:hypothetical protein PG985_013108 [Apiospora marii]|uniref:uncharacterized protein n=1 Tax=Apiospora marii TaxID=335849 RepID=UPI00312D39BF
MPPKKNEDNKKGDKKAPSNNRAANGDPGTGSSSNPPPSPEPQASNVLPGHVSRVDGKFVCEVPDSTGKLCGERIANKGGSIRNHKHKSHKGFMPETRNMPFEMCKYGKLSDPRTIQCVECGLPVSTPHALIQHYRANPETHRGLRTEAEIFARYPRNLQLEVQSEGSKLGKKGKKEDPEEEYKEESGEESD